MKDDKNNKNSALTHNNANIIELILKESKAYTSMELIESFISEQKSLSSIPVQPLYVSVRNLPLEYKTSALSLMTKKQREVFYDLDLWKKDELNVSEFETWVKACAYSPDDAVRFEFAESSEFALFLKGKFNIWTFDVEDPMYPDHDYYFLTEDNLLLFEYDDTCDIVDEVKTLVRELYSIKGVEKAYQYLFSVVSDGFMTLSEREYEDKKARLRNFGFVDYFDSLEILNTLPSVSHAEAYVKNKKKITANIDKIGQIQTLHQNSLVAFESDNSEIELEVAKIKDDNRFQYLHFNFVRLLNGNFEYFNVLKDSSLAMTRVGKRVKSFISLGLSFSKSVRHFGEESAFEYFDFADFFKIGHSLVSVVQKRLKKELASYKLDDEGDKFLGQYFEQFLDDFFGQEILFRQKGETESFPIRDVSLWNEANNKANLLITLLPFIKSFKYVYDELVSEGKVADSYYLNYDISSIDFEALLLSSFVNFSLGKFSKDDTRKMGVTITELKEFYNKFLKENDPSIIANCISTFVTSFGLDTILGVDEYLQELLSEHLEGYDLGELEESEFKHIGGPIIFNTMS